MVITRRTFGEDAFDLCAGRWPSGSVVIPAHNEARVILRTLRPLAAMACSGEIELLVVANGCTDDTAAVARSVPGTAVAEIAEASKPVALNVADAMVTAWPRLYLDADVVVSPDAVRQVLGTLSRGGIMAARPAMRYALGEASFAVRSFYRTRARLDETDAHLWGAGVYALSRAGRMRFDRFPDVWGDDLYVDAQFRSGEKGVLPTSPVVVQTPRTVRDLLKVMNRVYRGNRELRSRQLIDTKDRTTPRVARQLASSVEGPASLLDALLYALLVIWARMTANRTGHRWEHDLSSRSMDEVKASLGEE